MKFSELAKINPNEYKILLPDVLLQCKASTAFCLPSGMMAIVEAINFVYKLIDRMEDEQGFGYEMSDFSFKIEKFNETENDMWMITFIAEDSEEFYKTFDIKVIRNEKDFYAEMQK